MKKVIVYDIPIQSDEHVEEWNKKCEEVYGDKHIPYKSTDEHTDILIGKLYDAIEKVGEEGGWYVGDGIRVKIELEYEPEDK